MTTRWSHLRQESEFVTTPKSLNQALLDNSIAVKGICICRAIAGSGCSINRSLEAEKSDLETKVLERTLEDIGVVVTINELMAFQPTVVELKPSSASIQMVTKLPTTCSIAHGITTDYGQISTDDSMSRGGHTDHYHTLRGLQPDTVYHYKWGLLGPDGTFYASTDLTLKTPPSGGGASP